MSLHAWASVPGCTDWSAGRHHPAHHSMSLLTTRPHHASVHLLAHIHTRLLPTAGYALMGRMSLGHGVSTRGQSGVARHGSGMGGKRRSGGHHGHAAYLRGYGRDKLSSGRCHTKISGKQLGRLDPVSLVAMLFHRYTARLRKPKLRSAVRALLCSVLVRQLHGSQVNMF